MNFFYHVTWSMSCFAPLFSLNIKRYVSQETLLLHDKLLPQQSQQLHNSTQTLFPFGPDAG